MSSLVFVDTQQSVYDSVEKSNPGLRIENEFSWDHTNPGSDAGRLSP